MNDMNNSKSIFEKKIDDLNESLLGSHKKRGLLKDFQKETVEHIGKLFKNGQNRILVADEVGLGKTLIAKGAIAKVAKICLDERKKVLNVVYVCSNQEIARQNIKILNVFDAKLQIDDARLSMQHLNIMRSEFDSGIQNQYIQLIPLTPGTSFEIDGGGDANERALIYALLLYVSVFKKHEKALSRLLRLSCGVKSWKKCAKKKISELRYVVELCKKNKKKQSCIYKQDYPRNIIKKLAEEKLEFGEAHEQKSLFTVIKSTIRIIERENCRSRKCSDCEQEERCCRGKIVKALRNVFAQIGVEMLNPDLVIMDEFQRFNKLIRDTNDAESFLAQQFLKEYNGNQVRTRVLLLSATPYKLYSTIEELNTNSGEDPYEEFIYVMKFLFSKKTEEFERKWESFSKALKESIDSDFNELVRRKKLVEEFMYGGVCRTERISVMDGEKIVDVVGVKEGEFLKISEKDIQSYIQAQSLINECGCGRRVPVDYIKSCPFLMSYMENYVLKKEIVDALKNNKNVNVGLANQSLLWLSKEQVNKYEEIPNANARLQLLKENVFQNKSELLLWCPPSRPYYRLASVFADTGNFTKTLIFSSWEMVPKMISTLISYEAERRVRCNFQEKEYFSYKRTGLLNYDVNKLEGKQLFSEIYPSRRLSKIYNPMECLDMSIEEIRCYLSKKISPLLEEQKKYEDSGDDGDWYIASLLFMDDKKSIIQWMENLKASISVKNNAIPEDDYEDVEWKGEEDDDESDEEQVKEKKENDIRLRRLIDYAERILNRKIKLGNQPKDLLSYLVNTTMASFATCFYRSFDVKTDMMKATDFGRVFVRNFNNPEAMAILDSVNNLEENSSSRNYLDRVFNYCINGCFQGMLDEYIHLINLGDINSCQDDIIKNLDMLGSAARYTIDTFESLKKEVKLLNGKKDRFTMRSHFATCFSKSTGKSKGDRKESLRNAFNSPLRPFVLATTSIGQEGLDFHNYCRRIMHWNLPSNPIDLEQREGRINRYKCLAVRQNVALCHGEEPFKTDESLWNQMFERARLAENGGRFSELIPFWVFGKNQKIKIERLVPIYPFSADLSCYERLIKILSLYRLTMGQENQEDILDYVFSKYDDSKIEQLKRLFIDLSPYSRNRKIYKGS